MQQTDLQTIIFDITGSKVKRLLGIYRGGYTTAQRWLATMEDGRELFIKNATDSFTAKQLRVEYRICNEVQASFMPKVVGWFEGTLPVFVRENVDGVWPPPWDESLVSSFTELLTGLASYRTTAALPTAEQMQQLGRWRVLSESPDSYKTLQDLPGEWLREIFPTLLKLESSAVLGGESLIHFDLRGENICFTNQGIKIIDWDHAACGNPAIDRAMWRINLYIEGGPPPWHEDFTDIPVVAVLCGFFAYESSLSAPVSINPKIIDLQKRQFGVSLDWLTRIAKLPPSGGIVDRTDRRRR